MSASASCSVKVGVRIRPLLSKEKHQAVTLAPEKCSRQSLSFKGQQYSFDHVFGSDLSQQYLYQETAAPMLKGFLEGYNVTIMAYGQTGSGKTFTMGTGEMQDEMELQGLIPRFVTDLFATLKDNATSAHKAVVQVSFLEIYGEDVYDLISPTSATGGASSSSSSNSSNNSGNNNKDRPSLPVREDETGHVFVQGQQEVDVSSARAALDLLSAGSHNRITASTAMNAGSSRSHAVFTVKLVQEISGTEGEHDVHHVVSKLTFVDLAGSERIKRTGAEGQRLKEGIQINSGLFNLGQVINALADDQRLKHGLKAAHVPYRNSKLTHLLKDALGGNSQTLFLACVSPAESNESETHSTLNYAKQARNIQNKPVKNMDKHQLELRRLRYALKAWTINACKHMFGLSKSSKNLLSSSSGDSADGQEEGDAAMAAAASASAAAAALILSPLPNVSPAAKSGREEEILRRPEVQEYINAVNAMINEKLQDGIEINASALVRRLSLGTPPRHGYGGGSSGLGLHMARRGGHLHGPDSLVHRAQQSSSSSSVAADGSLPIIREGEELDDDGTFRGVSGHFADHIFGDGRGQHHHDSVLQSMALGRDSVFEATAPEETERLVSRMLEMVNKEKEQYVQDNKEIQGDIEMLAVDKAIEEKQEILAKLMDTVKGYSAMKADFEKLLEAIGGLETEKHELELELDRAKRAAEAGGGNGAVCSAAVERIKDRFQKVKKELDDMRDERKKKENAYRLMQKESKQCEALSKELKKLRDNKVSLVKQQKVQQAQFQKRQKETQAKVAVLKKSDVKKQQQMNTLKSELVKKERVLGHKDREIGRINSKLKACEEHIAQLLRIQNRNRARITNVFTPAGKPGLADGGKSALSDVDLEHLNSSKAMLDNLIEDRVDRHHMKRAYERKSSALQELNREMLGEALEMEALVARLKSLGGDADVDEDDFDDGCDDEERENGGIPPEVRAERASVRRDIRVCETSIDRITRELDLLNADLDDLSERMEETSKSSKTRSDRGSTSDAWEELGREIIAGFSLAQCQPLLWELLGEKVVSLETIKDVKDELMQCREQLETANERLSDTERQLQQCKADSKMRLEKAELQRVQDVWAVVKASSASTSSEDGSAGSESNNTATSVAILRAQELELEVESFMAAEEARKAEVASHEAATQDLRAQLEAAQLKLKMLTNAKTDPDATSDDSSPSAADADKLSAVFDSCNALWNDLGLAQEEREEAVTEMQQAASRAHAKIVSDAAEAVDKAKGDIERYKVDLAAVCSALSCPESTYLDVAALSKASKLLPQIALYEAALSAGEVVLRERGVKLCGLKERLLDLVSEMWLDITQLSPNLQALMRIMTADADPVELAHRLQEARACVDDEQILKWEGDLRKLNVTRAQTTNRLIALQKETAELSAALGVSTTRALQNVIGTKGLGEDVTAQATSGAIELVVAPQASNPPGSASLLAAAENLLLLLKNVRFQRASVVMQCGKVSQAFNEAAPVTAAALAKESEEEAGSHAPTAAVTGTVVKVVPASEVAYTQEQVMAAVHGLEDLCDGAQQSMPQIKKSIASVFADLSGSSSSSATNEVALDAKIDAIVTNAKAPSHLAAMSAAIAELGSAGMAPVVEELWLSQALEDLECLWTGCSADEIATWADSPSSRSSTASNSSSKSSRAQVSGCEAVRRCLVLRQELSRLTHMGESLKALRAVDAQLSKHVLEMEEFESNSKQDRAKLLAGSSLSPFLSFHPRSSLHSPTQPNPHQPNPQNQKGAQSTCWRKRNLGATASESMRFCLRSWWRRARRCRCTHRRPSSPPLSLPLLPPPPQQQPQHRAAAQASRLP